MTTCRSEDGRILYPWIMKGVEEFWNTWFSKKLCKGKKHEGQIYDLEDGIDRIEIHGSTKR